MQHRSTPGNALLKAQAQTDTDRHRQTQTDTDRHILTPVAGTERQRYVDTHTHAYTDTHIETQEPVSRVSPAPRLPDKTMTL